MPRFLPTIFLPLSRGRDNGNYLGSSVMAGRGGPGRGGVRGGVAGGDPSLEQAGGGFRQRGAARFAALAGAAQVGAGAEFGVGAGECGQLRDAQSALRRDQQQEVVASPQEGRLVRDRQQSLGLLVAEEAHECAVAALLRDSQDALNQQGSYFTYMTTEYRKYATGHGMLLI